jgi:hypothetical protein
VVGGEVKSPRLFSERRSTGKALTCIVYANPPWKSSSSFIFIADLLRRDLERLCGKGYSPAASFLHRTHSDLIHNTIYPSSAVLHLMYPPCGLVKYYTDIHTEWKKRSASVTSRTRTPTTLK